MKTGNAGLSLAAIASITLISGVAEAAECSGDVQTILSLSATASSLISNVGAVTNAGVALQNTLICGENEVLDIGAVVDSIGDEVDDAATQEVEAGLFFAQSQMESLADALAGNDPAFVGVDFETMDASLAARLQEDVEGVHSGIRAVELNLLPLLSSRNNARLSYDLSAAIMLANHKLALVQLSTAASREDRHRDFAIAVADEIVRDIEIYQEESDRLRGMSIDIERTPTASTGWIVRSGQRAALGAKQSYEATKANSRRDLIDDDIRETIESTIFEPFLAELDVQDAHFAMLKARAEAILADPFGGLEDVRTTAQAPVMLKSAAPGADERCLFNRRGFLGVDGELSSGATRMRPCTPNRSHQQWVLEADGHVRSSIANLCLTASPSKAVMIEECAPEDPRQLWTRVGNQFRVDVDGVQTCLAPSKSGVNDPDVVARHMPCDAQHPGQQWLAYAPMRQGKALAISGVEPGPVSSEQVQNLAQQFGAVVNQGICVRLRSSLTVTLRACNRFALDQLWAHDGEGRLRPFDFGRRSMSLDPEGHILGENVSASETIGLELFFDRSADADGTVVYTRRDNGDFLFAELQPTRVLRTGEALIGDDGDLDGTVIWQHSAIGKRAE